jgi:nucleoid-associated protein YgaU
LAIGIGLALLFPRPAGEGAAAVGPEAALVSEATASTRPPEQAAFEGQLSPLAPVRAQLTASSEGAADATSLDPATAPAVVRAGPSFDEPVGTADAGRPVYATDAITAAPGELDAAGAAYRVHVIHNGDTLERLAERYLGDGARALEIFDLNRDVLDNPHVLRLGAEIKVPIDAATGD